MAKFTFTDFLVFTGASNVNEDTYVTIAKGVIGYLKAHYGIYLEADTLTQNVFLATGQLSVTPKAFPVNSVTSLTHDGTVVDDTTYSYYGEDILMTETITEIRKPLILVMDVGYATDTIPDDLIFAAYRHILAVYHAVDKHSDNISKSINSDGNTTYFKSDVVPPACRQTYQYYAGATILSY